jgi:hypothetical protein
LAAGAYRVCASRTDATWSIPGGCFGGPSLINQPYMAGSVWVRAGEETANIDIDLGQPHPPAAYLPLVAREVLYMPPFSATALVDSNVRVCPSTGCAITGVVLAGTVVTVIGCVEYCAWYQLDVDRWVLGALFEPHPPAGRATP